MNEPDRDNASPVDASVHPFSALDPGLLLDMVESAGLAPDGRLLALNSYENRVYQIGLDDGDFVILKVYRPGRWSAEALQEEHSFAHELADHDIPVVPPLAAGHGTLQAYQGFFFAVYPRRGGHAPELDDPQTLEWLGRLLGRLHTVGAARQFQHRPRMSAEWMGRGSRDFLLAEDWIPEHLEPAYRSLTDGLLLDIEASFERAGEWTPIRLHGDFHPGNILWTPAGPHLVDLDDCRIGPAIQDLWMMLAGDRLERTTQLADLLTGYEQFCEFDPRELQLLEALRTLRMMHYAAWLARRWDDPAFPAAFPWFGDHRYWEAHVLSLREQAAAMQEPPLCV